MKRKKQELYDEEFKKTIVEIYEKGLSSPLEIVRDYKIGKSTLYKWLDEYGNIDNAKIKDLKDGKIERLEKDVNKFKEESEVLKKAIIILIQGSDIQGGV